MMSNALPALHAGFRRIETLGQPVIAQLATTMPTRDAASVRDALHAAARLYIALRDDEPPRESVAHMPEALWACLQS